MASKKPFISPGVVAFIILIIFCLFIPKIAMDCSEGNKTDAYKLRQAKIDEATNLEEPIHHNIRLYIAKKLNDYKSYEAVDWYPLTKVNNQPYDYYMVHSYRASNRFGALVLRTQKFCLDSDYNVVRVKEQEE